MLLKAGIFIFLLLLPGEGGLLPKDGILPEFDLFKKKTPQLVKVKAITPPSPFYERRIIERRLGLVVFELDGDPEGTFTDYIVSSLLKKGRFRVLHLERLSLPYPLSLRYRGLEKVPLVEAPPLILSTQQMAEKIGADLAIMGRVDEEGRVHLRLVDLKTDEILMVSIIRGSMDEIFREIDGFLSKVYSRFPLLEGEVVYRRGNLVYTDLGALDGMRVGMELIVYRVKGLERVPPRGWIFGVKTEDIGLIKVSQVTEVGSEARIMRILPLCEISVGDKVITR